MMSPRFTCVPFRGSGSVRSRMAPGVGLVGGATVAERATVGGGSSSRFSTRALHAGSRDGGCRGPVNCGRGCDTPERKRPPT